MGSAEIREQAVVTATTTDGNGALGAFGFDLEDEARVVFQFAAKAGAEAEAAGVHIQRPKTVPLRVAVLAVETAPAAATVAAAGTVMATRVAAAKPLAAAFWVKPGKRYPAWAIRWAVWVVS